MKIKIIISLALMASSVMLAQGQQKYITKAGYAKFFSSAPLEDIEAINNKVTSIIDFEKNNVVISIPISAFEFDKSLMREHFNENYMETEKHPNAQFKGSFSALLPIEIGKSGVYNVTITGDLTIHGVTKPLTTAGTIEFDNKGVVGKTIFNVKTADFDIEIPKLVFKNIAEVVEVTIELNYALLKS